MATSAERRTRALLSTDEAYCEGNQTARSILVNMARNWISLANQTDRLAALRGGAGGVRPKRRYLQLVPTLWP
jgi:hypothetical protein